MAPREEGLIRHLGVSNVTPAQFAEARASAPIACVQNAYNIALRADEGIAYVPFFPVGGFQPLTAEHLTAVAAGHGATAAQVASRDDPLGGVRSMLPGGPNDPYRQIHGCPSPAGWP